MESLNLHPHLRIILLISLILIPLSQTSSALTFTLKRKTNEQTKTTHKFQSLVQSSHTRARNLASPKSTSQAPLHPEYNDLFFIEIEVGTPPVKFEALADLGSDLLWFQCLPCDPCLNNTLPIFDPSKSSTYVPVSCNNTSCNYIDHNCTTTLKQHTLRKKLSSNICSYTYNYAVSYTTGVLSYDSITMGGTKVSNVTFGCGHNNQKFGYVGGGFVGLGRGPLSLFSQLGHKLGADKFSYCLPSLSGQSTATSPLVFGQGAGFSGATQIPLPPNPGSPSFWYLPVTGLSVSGSRVPLPNGTFAINPNGSGGMIIDTGVNILLLYQTVYDAMIGAIKKGTNRDPSREGMEETKSDLCYDGLDAGLKVAPLSFVFEGGEELALPLENYFVKGGSEMKYICIAAAVTAESFSVFGNIAQQNVHFLFDRDSFTFAFRHAQCDQL